MEKPVMRSPLWCVLVEKHSIVAVMLSPPTLFTQLNCRIEFCKPNED